MFEISNKNIELFKKTSLVWKEGSTCARLKVGCCIFNKKGRCVITSYNGTISGMLNCNAIFNFDDNSVNFDKLHELEPTWEPNLKGIQNIKVNKIRDLHHKFSEKYEIHAEMNAILNLNKTNSNVSLQDCIIMITTEPCINCMKLIAASGIKTVFYIEKYDRNDETVISNLSKNLGLNMIKI
jgi:deoxycytidylate deaminase